MVDYSLYRSFIIEEDREIAVAKGKFMGKFCGFFFEMGDRTACL